MNDKEKIKEVLEFIDSFLVEKGGDEVIVNWDGMMAWFLEYVSKHEHVLKDDPYIAKWYNAAKKNGCVKA